MAWQIFKTEFITKISSFLQIDIHAFGGNATSSLTSSIYCLTRSFLAVGILIGFAYGGLTGEAHSPHTQEILFSIFCSLAVSISYHLSRSSSDPTVILSLIKRQLLMPPPTDSSSDLDIEDRNIGSKKDCDIELQKIKKKQATDVIGEAEKRASSDQHPTDQNNENDKVPSPAKSSTESTLSSSNTLTTQDPLPKKLCDTVYARLKSDSIICVLIAVVTFFLHWSGFFLLLQPNLNYVLWVVAVVIGFFLHYILPQLRKQLPWLCFSHPVLKSKEYGQFEVCMVLSIYKRDMGGYSFGYVPFNLKKFL